MSWEEVNAYVRDLRGHDNEEQLAPVDPLATNVAAWRICQVPCTMSSELRGLPSRGVVFA